jgi:hypothetical protein
MLNITITNRIFFDRISDSAQSILSNKSNSKTDGKLSNQNKTTASEKALSDKTSSDKSTLSDKG